MITRREHIATLGLLTLLAPVSKLWASDRTEPFSWAALVARARALAARSYQPQAARVHAHTIDYDAVSQIAYRADKTLWREKGGETTMRFFPLNRHAQLPVAMHIVEGGRAVPFPYSAALFDADTPALAALMAESDGFAGFRALNANGIGDWLAFQGASYFRSAGSFSQYGLSARGIAVNTSVPGVSEEFPVFTHFWIERTGDDSFTVYALLDGPSIAGAYRFENHKLGDRVVQDVTTALFTRRAIQQLGIAPLTSMFWYGEGDRLKAIDWRPEVHDSDGLALQTGDGERIWRPLINPPRPMTNSFADKGPKGFGLLQRDRNLDHYQDDGVFYEKRPSLWVEPRGNWGKGAVTLYEIPTTREYEDNIVAFWSPAAPVRAGARLEYAYRLSWIGDEPAPPPVARTVDVWTGTAGRPAADPIPGARKIVADFAGDTLDRYDRSSGVIPAITLSHGKLLEAHCYPVAGRPGRWRLMADIASTGSETSDFRAFLKLGDAALTETLLYQLHWPIG